MTEPTRYACTGWQSMMLEDADGNWVDYPTFSRLKERAEAMERDRDHHYNEAKVLRESLAAVEAREVEYLRVVEEWRSATWDERKRLSALEAYLEVSGRERRSALGRAWLDSAKKLREAPASTEAKP